MSELRDFQHGQRVTYRSAGRDENGTVSSVGKQFVFVKFDEQVMKFGWDKTTAKACDPRTIERCETIVNPVTYFATEAIEKLALEELWRKSGRAV